MLRQRVDFVVFLALWLLFSSSHILEHYMDFIVMLLHSRPGICYVELVSLAAHMCL